MIMNYILALTCEYIFDIQECHSYLTSVEIDPVKYEYIYKPYYQMDVKNNRRKIRKLYNAATYDLSEYRSLMSVRFDDYFHGYDVIIKYPDTLIYLIFGRHFDAILDFIPSSVQYLIIGDMYDRRLSVLPDTLKIIHVHSLYPHLTDLLNTYGNKICIYDEYIW
jgi:hypothetical protein